MSEDLRAEAARKRAEADALDEKADAVAADPQQLRDHAREFVKDNTGLEIKSLLHYPGDPEFFELTMDNGRKVRLANLDKLATNGEARKVFLSLGCGLIPRAKPKEWDLIAGYMVQLEEDVDLGEDADPDQVMAQLVRDYLQGTSHLRFDKERFVNPGEPGATVVAPEPHWVIYHEDAIHIRVDGLQGWCKVHTSGDPMPRALILKRIKSLGATPATLHFGAGAERTTRYYWRLPPTAFRPRPSLLDANQEPREED